MANLKYSDKHNMVAFLKKPNESVGFTEVVDFLKGISLMYALTHNPTIYDSLVQTFGKLVTVRNNANGTQQLVASIDSKEYTITEASVRSKLQLADATGIHNLSDAEIYAGLATLGYVTKAQPHPTPVDPLPSTSLPPIPSPPPQFPPHQSPPHSPHQSPPHSPPYSPHQSPPHSPLQSSPYSLPRSYEAPLPEGNTSGSAEDSVQLKELMILLPNLVDRVTSLEKELKDTKQTLGNVVLKFVKKGRIIHDIDDDPLVSLVRESMKEKLTDFVTPTKASGEAQEEEEISPTILEEAKTLVEINSGIEDVNTGSSKVDTGRREGKAQMVKEDIQATHKTKEQIRQEEAGLEEAIRLQAQMDKEGKINWKEEEETDVQLRKTRMRRKQKARKGINIDKTAQDEFNKEREAYVKDKVKDASQI
ncbi:hypothetical protein Tco_0963747 [Tanacetum coccineum]